MIKQCDDLYGNICLQVPSAVAVFPKELFQAPEAWLRQQFNLKSYSTFETGGHFAALEEPEALVRDMCQFYSSLELRF